MRLTVIGIVLCALLLQGCQPTVPKEYIQPDDMEDILYDYFVSQGAAQERMNSPAEGEFNQELYFNAVLKKYDVSRADFDSSLVYYYTRADRFMKVMKNVQDRLGDDAIEYGASASEVERFTVTSLTGDTANIWNGDLSRLLVPYAPYNRMEFAVKADTAFRQGDSFMLTFNSNFLYQSGSKDAVAYMAVRYANDSVAAFNTHFSASGMTQLRTTGCDVKIKDIVGFVYLGMGYLSDTGLKLLMLDNIQLIRFHKQKDDPKKALETQAAQREDSLRQQPDSLRPVRHRLGERPQPSVGNGPSNQNDNNKPITR